MNGWQLLALWAAFLVGVMLQTVWVFDTTFTLYGLGAALVIGLCWRLFGNSRLLFLSLLCLCVTVGVWRTHVFETQFLETGLASGVGERVSVTGLVVREPDERANFTQLYVQTDTDRILVRTDRYVDVVYGDEVQVAGRLEAPTVFETDIGRTFDYPNYLKVRGVQYVMSFAEVEVQSSDNGNWLLANLYIAKQTFVATLEKSIASPQVDLGVGLLLGVKQALGDELETAFRQTGIIHIVVLSGYNVMLVVGFFWWLSSWVLPIYGRIVFSLVGIVLFALVVGLSATVVRASIMASLLLFGKLIGRRYDVLRALLFAAAVMVLINPYILLYDIGFQLSFMATLGLVLVLPQFESTLATKASTLKLKDLFFATTVTQVFVLPLLMYHIGEVSLVSVMVNMLVLPIVPLAMLATFVVGLIGLVSTPLAGLLALLAYLPLQYIIMSATWFAQLPFAAVVVPEVSLLMMLVMYAVLAMVYVYWMQVRTVDGTENVAAIDDMKDWVIVDEDKRLESNDSSRLSDTPAFFR